MLIKSKASYHTASLRRSRWDLWLIPAYFFLCIISSWHLVSSDLTNGLSTEMILSAQTLGISQTPGMAVYLAVSKLLHYLLPVQNLVLNYGYLSLLFTVAAGLLVYLTGRQLHYPPVVSFSSALIFFYSPLIWKTALLPHHFPADVLILTVTVLLTIRFITLTRRAWLMGNLVLWAATCGLTATQDIAFLPWGLALFVLGLSVGLPRLRALGLHYLTAFLIFTAAALLPVFYLPLRLTAGHVFFNSDYVYQYATLARHWSWSRLLAWLVWYMTGGHHPVFWFQTYAPSMMALGGQLWTFLKTYPFMPLTIMLLGLLSNVKTIFVKQRHPAARGMDHPGRLLIALLPLIAIGGSVMLLPNLKLPLTLGLTLGGTYWSLRGLEFCYYQLGQSAVDLAKGKRLKPTAFALFVVLVVPVFSFLHTYLDLKHQIRHAANQDSNLYQAQRLLSRLPARSVLVFPHAESSFLFQYCQRQLGLAPEMMIVPFSYHWPEVPYQGPSLLKGFYRQGKGNQQHRLLYMAYWTRQLNRYLAQGRPVYFLSHVQNPDPVFDYFLQSFHLQEAATPLHIWYRFLTSRSLSIYQVSSLPVPARVSYAPVGAKPLGTFNEAVAITQATLMPLEINRPDRPLFHCRLSWLIQRPIGEEQLYVQFQVLPLRGAPKLKMLDGQWKRWRTIRRLGPGRLLNRINPQGHFDQTYQLAIPTRLLPGTYQLQVSVINPKTKERLSAGEAGTKATYFLTLDTFEITASGLERP